jgi:type IV secretory pathway VirD2 relaxase
MSRNRKSGGVKDSSPDRKSFHQRCAVRVTYSRNTIKGEWRAHGRYIARDSATRAEERETGGFDDKSDALDMTVILDGWQRSGDERMWKLIVSPEFGERVDLPKLTRELMAQVARDLGSAPEWTAVSHHNTEHPHVHIALRGVDATGRPLRLERDYIKHGIRALAEDLCTRQLGYRTDRDAAESAAREVRGQGYTSLDRDISRTKDGVNTSTDTFQVLLAPVFTDSARIRQRHMAERLLVLEKMGLAITVGPDRWHVRRDFESVLRAMQRTNDRQKTMAAHGVLLSDARLPLVMLDQRTLKSIEGRVLVHGQEEDGRDAGRSYFLLEGTDARVHYVPHTPEIEGARNRGGLRVNAFVRLRKLLVDGKPILETEDFGDAEAILKNKRHLNEAARAFSRRGVLPTEEGWGGWIGRSQKALRTIATEAKHRDAESLAINTNRHRMGR